MSNSRDQRLQEQINAYVQGRLNEAEINALWQEIAKDPSLLDDLELEVGIRKILRESAQAKHKPLLYQSPKWRRKIATAAVVLIAVTLSIQLLKTDNPPAATLDNTLVASITADQVETGMNIRSVEHMEFTWADSLLNLGFEAVFSGNADRGLEIFDKLIEQYPDEPYGSKAYLNRGIILYNQKDFVGAELSFREAADRSAEDTMTREKAYWFLSNASARNGNLESALEAARITLEMEGLFLAQALKLSQLLSDLLEDPGPDSQD